MSRIGYWLMLLGMPLLMAACSSTDSPDGIAPGDKLSKEELDVMIAHVRSFVKAEGKKFNLKPDDITVIERDAPKVKTFYQGHKRGRLSLGWQLKDRLIFAILEGDFIECKDWRIMISKNADVIYYKKNRGQNAEPKILEEFGELRNR